MDSGETKDGDTMEEAYFDACIYLQGEGEAAESGGSRIVVVVGKTRKHSRMPTATSAFTRCSIEFRPGAARFSLYLFCSSTR